MIQASLPRNQTNRRPRADVADADDADADANDADANDADADDADADDAVADSEVPTLTRASSIVRH